jgi:hypothetical protein
MVDMAAAIDDQKAKKKGRQADKDRRAQESEIGKKMRDAAVNDMVRREEVGNVAALEGASIREKQGQRIENKR